MPSNFGKIRPQTAELAALEFLEIPLKTYTCNGENGVSTFSRLFPYLRTINDFTSERLLPFGLLVKCTCTN